MSEIRTAADYYLTEDGWFEGTKEPANSAERWHMESSQLTYVAPEARKWSNTWRSPKYTRQQCDELRRRYPFPDQVRPHPMQKSTFGDPLA